MTSHRNAAGRRETISTLPPDNYHVNAGLRMDYEVTEGIQLGTGSRNLFDDTY